METQIKVGTACIKGALSSAHLLCGGGGCRAVLASCGAFIAFDLAGIEFESIGGISGGAIPAVLRASEKDLDSIIRLALNLKFNKLITRRDGMWLPSNIARPQYGIYDSANLGSFVEGVGCRWSSRFWTAAVSNDSILAFLAKGTFQRRISIHNSSDWHKLSTNVPGIGLAIRATVAIPAFISGIPSPFEDGEFLFDGGLGPEGRCPVSIPRSLFGASKGILIVIDVGSEGSLGTRVIEYLGRLVTGTKWSSPELPIYIDQSIILVRPKITQVTTFDFTARKDLKWFAIIEGYLATFEKLKELGCLAGNPVEAASEWIVATNIFRNDMKKGFLKALFSIENKYDRLPR
ncbi:MAG: patatin-like phospholipase family protein [Cyanobacteriota/Melainabacteria group bacterium]